MYSRNLKRIIEHKIYMALVLNEKRAGLILDTEDCLGYERDAVIIAEKIEAEYENKNGAGAIWLAGLIKNDKILDIL